MMELVTYEVSDNDGKVLGKIAQPDLVDADTSDRVVNCWNRTYTEKGTSAAVVKREKLTPHWWERLPF